MSYLVLARKFRPQTFASIIGQEHISLALGNAIVRDRVPHAILLTGPRGVGKTTSARVFAKSLNCLKRPESAELSDLSEAEARSRVEPCNECVNCQEISRSNSLAVWEIDGASNNSVENVRELIDSLRSLPPPGARFKIYIIDEVHMLSVAAFNALLKSLEEPPPNTVFIFATTEAHKIPETVVSRCQRYDFRRLPTNCVIDQLRSIATEEKIEVDEEVFSLIARKANGGMRDAQSMFDRLLGFSVQRVDRQTAESLLGFIDRELLYRFADAVATHDSGGCFALLHEAFSQTLDIRSFCADFIEFWRNLLLVRLTKDGGVIDSVLQFLPEERRRFIEVANRFEPFDLQRLFDLASKTVDGALQSSHPRYVFEAGAAKMATLSSLRPLGKILAELDRGGVPLGDRSEAQLRQSPPARAAEVVVPPLSPQRNSPQVTNSSTEVQQPVASGSRGELGSWSDFVMMVGNSGELLLTEFLKRVTPIQFIAGELLLEGMSFDLQALRDQNTLAKLRGLLTRFAGGGAWNIQFREGGAAPSAGGKPGAMSRQAPVTTGSLKAQEESRRKQEAESLTQSAKENPAVRAALSTFEGSAIAGVSVLKE